MFGMDLKRHAPEFLRYLQSHAWEHADDGSIYLPKARSFIRGEFSHAKNDEGWETDSNLVVTEGLVYALQACITNDVNDVTTWYLAPFGNNYTPVAALTAATFSATTGELSGAPEGYSEAARQAWVPDAVDSGTTDVVNDASPAAFTMVTASTIDVNGAGMLSASAKNGASGVLFSASKFANTRTYSNGDTFNLKYKVDANPS